MTDTNGSVLILAILIEPSKALLKPDYKHTSKLSPVS